MEQRPARRTSKPLTRVLSILMTAAMVASLVPAPALAAQQAVVDYEGTEDEPTHINSITLDPYTYVDKSRLINDGNTGAVELNEANLQPIADQLFADWGPIAYRALETNTSSTYHNNDTFQEDYGPNAVEEEENVRLEQYLSGRNTPDKFTRGERENDIVMTSGLSYATSLNDALRNAAYMTSYAMYRRNTDPDGVYEQIGLDNIKKMTDKTKVYYRTVVSINNEGSTSQYLYNVYTLAFYDFTLSPIVAPGITAANSHVIDNAADDNDSTHKISNFFENRSQSETEISAEQSTETVESVSNSIENTESFGFEESIGSEVEIEGKFFGAKAGYKLSASFTANQAIETAYGKESSLEDHYSSGMSTSVTLPPHTAISVDQTSGKSTTTIQYDCPTALNYKVAIFSFSGYRYDDDALVHQWDSETCFSSLFGTGSKTGGSTAPENLYLRALDPKTANKMEQAYGQTSGYDEGIIKTNALDWDQFDEGVMSHAQNIVKNIPMIASGATMTATTQSKTSSLGQIVPLYQLTEVKVVKGEDVYDMVMGDAMNLGVLELAGYNDQGVEYYGFDGEQGHWVLCNEDGAELQSSPVLSLSTNSATHKQTAKAIGVGDAYIKWVIDDGVTFKAKYGDVVSNAENAPAYPLVPFRVTQATANLDGYRVETSGEATVVAKESLDLNKAFPAAVYDNKDRIISRVVSYETRDFTGPATVSADGTFVAVTEGDYEVRAIYARDGAAVESSWVIVHVTPEPVVESVVANPAVLTAEGGQCTVTIKGQHLHDGLTIILAETLNHENKASAKTTGSDTEQSATFTLAGVTDFNESVDYDVAFQIAGTTYGPAAGITVRGNTIEAVEAKDATCTEDGNIAHWKCENTGLLYADAGGTVEISAEDVVLRKLGHDLAKVEAADATCDATGISEHWKCGRCQKLFADEAGTKEVTADQVTVEALGHEWGAWVETKPATETEEGEEQRVCARDASHVQTRATDVLAHTHVLVKTEAKEATCTEDGNIEYWTCSGCGGTFADDKGEVALAADDTVVAALGHEWGAWVETKPATETEEGEEQRVCARDASHVETRVIPVSTHVHDLVNVAQVAESCTEDGNIEHWTCGTCGKLFSDAQGTVELNAEDVVVKATGHAWDEGSVTTPPSCTSTGVRTYTCRNEPSHTKTEDVAALGHAWDEGFVTTPPTCTNTGIRTFTCLNNPDHTRIEDVDPTGHAWDEGSVTATPTCTKTGIITFTCLNNPAHTKTEVIDATGHDWNEPTYEWTDANTVVATRRCSHDPSHTEAETVAAVSAVTTAPTCTDKGVRTYTATFKNGAFAPQTKTEAIPALGHKWGKVTYTWSSNNKKLVATRTCTHDASHVQTAKAKVTSVVAKQPTELKKGKRTYTGTFSASWAKTRTKSVAIDALGMPDVFATARVQGRGWFEYEPGSTIVGTTNASRGLQALTLKLTNAHVTGSIQYRSHVQGSGWQKGWKSNGAVSGVNSSKAKPTEAVQIRLTGQMAKKYDVYYRVHAQGYGWMGWAKNGAQAGSQGMKRRIEAIQIVFVMKGSKAPAKTYNGIARNYAKAFVSK